MECRLVAVVGGGQESYVIKDGASTLGRDTDNPIQIVSPGVSRHHAKFTNISEACRIEDLKSTNGTYVNGKPITAQNLRHGDQVTVGEMMLRFEQKLASSELTSANSRDYSKRAQQATVMIHRHPGEGAKDPSGLGPKSTGGPSPFHLKPGVQPAPQVPGATPHPEKAQTQPINMEGVLRFRAAKPPEPRKS